MTLYSDSEDFMTMNPEIQKSFVISDILFKIMKKQTILI